MKNYQNVSQSLKASSFIEVGAYTGEELTFKASSPTTMMNGAQVKFAKSALTVRKPRDVVSCATSCSVGTVTESISIDFNVVDEASLDALWLEAQRVYALTKASLVHGILPPVYSTFAEA